MVGLRLGLGMAVPLSGGRAYWQKILNTQRANLIGLWRLNETAGTVAVDSSPEGNNGAYTGVSLANAAGPDGVLVPFWDGLNDYLNIYSAAFSADFNGSEGTIAIWHKINSAAVWTDGSVRMFVKLQADGSNYVDFYKDSVNNQLRIRYDAGGTLKGITKSSYSPTAWVHYAVTWSKSADQVRIFINGSQEGATQTGLGIWAGSLNALTTNIGAATTAPLQVHHGWLELPSIWKVALTPTEVLNIATL